MKVLIINGSPRVNGNTTIAVREMEQTFAKEGVEVETVQIGKQDINSDRVSGLWTDCFTVHLSIKP